MTTKGRTKKDTEHQDDFDEQLRSFLKPFVEKVVRPKAVAKLARSMSSEDIEQTRNLIKMLPNLAEEMGDDIDSAEKQKMAEFIDEMRTDEDIKRVFTLAPEGHEAVVAKVVESETGYLLRAWMNALYYGYREASIDIEAFAASLNDKMMPTLSAKRQKNFEQALVNSEYLEVSDALQILYEARRSLPDGQKLPPATRDFLVAISS